MEAQQEKASKEARLLKQKVETLERVGTLIHPLPLDPP